MWVKTKEANTAGVESVCAHVCVEGMQQQEVRSGVEGSRSVRVL